MARRVFVLNVGSATVKYRLVDVDAGRALAWGLADRIGAAAGGGRLVQHDTAGEHTTQRALPDQAAAVGAILDTLAPDGLLAVAHRVVHGGARFRAAVRVDDDVLNQLDELAVLAPLHNPVNVAGIELARRVWPDVPHVAVFDTAFHHTLPAHAYTYAVPREWAARHGVRRYGFHGTSYAYVSRAAARHLGRDVADTDLIVLHLGNGASAAAIAGGRSVDTSMGLTPLEGLVMGTRSGDVDPALVLHLRRTAGLGVEEIDDLLNTRSGLLALAGDGDMREVHRRVAAGDRDAVVALEVYCHRVRKYVGAYLAVLGGADAIVFTAGVGEHDPVVRERSLAGLERLGIAIDAGRNAAASTEPRTISPDAAGVAVLVVPTDEELEMAVEAAALVAGGRRPV
jgi:acetate kinase